MIVLGRIVAPYGVRGWVKIRPFADDPAAWGSLPRWWLADDPEGPAWQAYALTGCRPQGALWVAKLAGIDDRAAAEAIDGRYVGAPREEMPVTARDEYYWGDLLGLAVHNEQDEFLGRVASLLESGAHPVLEVKDGETRRLLPFVADVVKTVDVAGDCIRVAWGLDW